MFKVVSLYEALNEISRLFGDLRCGTEPSCCAEMIGRYLAEDIALDEDYPHFNRSTVDGYAVKSADVQGCSDSIPAILLKTGEVLMGELSTKTVHEDECIYVPTGGAIPAGADAMVMIEFSETLIGNEIAIYKSVAPGQNMIFKGEDGKAGEIILRKGKRLLAGDIGTLSMLGKTEGQIFKKPNVAVISTGDELVEAGTRRKAGQIYDVNRPLIQALLSENGASAQLYPIVPDDERKLREILASAAKSSDLVLVSGGTSVGVRDALPRCLEALGSLAIHGIAVKPGKPTIIGKIGGVPVFGMPGNPVAAFFIFKLCVAPLLVSMQGGSLERKHYPGILTKAVSSNHGREELILANFREGMVEPIASKSGLISTVSKANAYFVVPRDTEGYSQGSQIQVYSLEE